MIQHTSEQKALNTMLCLTVSVGVCGIILCSVARYIKDQAQVGTPIMITGFALLGAAGLCGFLYLRTLCAQQSQIADEQPVPIGQVLDNPSIIIVVSKPQDEDPTECRSAYTGRV